MIVRKLRLQRGWSQEQLATFSGLSIRTIQRIERGQKASLETLNALAAVFEIDVSQLQGEEVMENSIELSTEERQVIESVRDIKAFYAHLIIYLIMVPTFFVIDLMSSPQLQWAWWPVMGWGIGVASHGLNVFEVFNLFGTTWEKEQIEKRLGRKL
ncbi:MAG: Pr2TM family membrane protein [Gammaproteobacteria bacterium]|jgi:transcriptional regulator with XRE-family HTH domain|nr:Pr2TM family membrane protein [Gammaproteobacteria bacterium]MBT4606639.1 Pr2TM family membrane protein [Thiotrichales bacterium]MBT3472628.1 Pr2TM family membrane protein [Gammaproteobacteria bacterium]MBT3966879.1 Pr2TM family membrane protein [Gammaproteobacteria bacterium]MBT4079509.1 Pr2TM family membrane protein [Gammaproteobacteria bacterium]